MLAHGLGILVADGGWPLIPSSSWHGLALASALGAAVLVSRPGAVKGLALVLAFGAGAASLSTRLDSAARFAPRESRELTLEARVCGLERGGLTHSVELCAGTEVPSPGSDGLGAPARPLPLRLLGQFRASSPEADALGSLRRGDRVRARVRSSRLGVCVTRVGRTRLGAGAAGAWGGVYASWIRDCSWLCGGHWPPVPGPSRWSHW